MTATSLEMADDLTPHLPPELLSKIVEFFLGEHNDRPSIVSFMLASREFYAVGLPVLWREFELSTNTAVPHGFHGDRIRQILETGRRIGALHLVRRVSVTGGRGWSDDVAEFLSAVAENLCELVVEGLESDVASRLWNLVKNGPRLTSLRTGFFFPGLLGPDGAFPGQIRRFTCRSLHGHPGGSTESAFQAVDRSENLAEWILLSFNAPLDLLEKYPNAASKLRIVDVYSDDLPELVEYAEYCPNLETLDVITCECTDVWSVIPSFPLLRELGIMGPAPSRIFERLIRTHSDLDLPRGLRIMVSLGTLDLDPADLDELATVLCSLNWRIGSLHLMVEPEAGVELTFWEGITRVTR